MHSAAHVCMHTFGTLFKASILVIAPRGMLKLVQFLGRLGRILPMGMFAHRVERESKPTHTYIHIGPPLSRDGQRARIRRDSSGSCSLENCSGGRHSPIDTGAANAFTTVTGIC